MGDLDQEKKEYFDALIQKKCSALRLKALSMMTLMGQLERLEAKKAQTLEEYKEMETDLLRTASMAKEILGLGDGWVCAVDEGVLVPPPKSLGESEPEETQEDGS